MRVRNVSLPKRQGEIVKSLIETKRGIPRLKKIFVRSNKAHEYELIRSVHMLIYTHTHTYSSSYGFDNVIGFVQSVPLD